LYKTVMTLLQKPLIGLFASPENENFIEFLYFNFSKKILFTGWSLYRKNQSGRWELTESRAGENIKIESIDCTLDLEEVYVKSGIVNT